MIRTTIMLVLFLLAGNLTKAQLESVIIDERDGEVYKIIKIDSLFWFTENLRYKTLTSAYIDSTKDYKKIGLVYKDEDRYSVCPKGWRLPTRYEFESLFKNESDAFYKLADPDGWIIESKGSITNALGLSIMATENIPISKKKVKRGYIESTSFWLDTQNEKELYHVHIRSGKIDLHSHPFAVPNPNRFSVRCVCDEKFREGIID